MLFLLLVKLIRHDTDKNIDVEIPNFIEIYSKILEYSGFGFRQKVIYRS